LYKNFFPFLGVKSLGIDGNFFIFSVLETRKPELPDKENFISDLS